ncbi:MAG TPA: Uma2 family endonuclease [Thermoanaerobaculia bacterium]|nr:Uma2 family endonuclease [Thermoanaerobaculia bacterium]
MPLHTPAPKLTYEDYILLPEDRRRHEVIDGRHYATATPFIRHQDLVVALAFDVQAFLKTNDLGRLLIAPVDVLLSPHDIVQPDLLFVSAEQAHILKKRYVRGAPDLVVEVLSEGTRRRDQGLKLRRYERFGVREYWLVDPDRKAVTVYRLRVGDFVRVADLSTTAGDVLTTPMLPGLEIRLAALFGLPVEGE